MNSFSPSSLVSTLLALQFVIFGWRISREIALGDQGRRTWLLFSDYLNFAALLAVVSFCVIYPLHLGVFGKLSRAVLGGGYVLVCMTPLTIAGHYRLFSREGRTIYEKPGKDYPWMTAQEIVLTIVALIASSATSAYIAMTG